MRATQAILKTLIDRKADVFRPLIANDLADPISLLPSMKMTASGWLQNPYPFLDKIDITWLESNEMRLHELGKSPIPQVANFAKYSLWKSLTHLQTHSLPFQAACEMRLGNLLELSKTEIIKLFHLLGLFDLSLDLKKIVQTQTLQAIKSALNPTQTQFLQSLSHKATTVDFGRLDLNRWDKKTQTLQDVLFNRGLNRLAKALVTTDSTVAWYFERILDKTTGSKLKKLYSDLKNPSAHQALLAEVHAALDHIRRPA